MVLPAVLLGLDLGASKIVAVVAVQDESGLLNVTGASLASPEGGIRQGEINDMDLTVRAIGRAVEEAMRTAGQTKLDGIRVCVGGSQFRHRRGLRAPRRPRRPRDRRRARPRLPRPSLPPDARPHGHRGGGHQGPRGVHRLRRAREPIAAPQRRGRPPCSSAARRATRPAAAPASSPATCPAPSAESRDSSFGHRGVRG